MKRFKLLTMTIMMVFVALGFASCDKDEVVNYNIENTVWEYNVGSPAYKLEFSKDSAKLTLTTTHYNLETLKQEVKEYVIPYSYRRVGSYEFVLLAKENVDDSKLKELFVRVTSGNTMIVQNYETNALIQSLIKK